MNELLEGTDCVHHANVGFRQVVKEFCRKHGISDAIFHNRKAKYRGKSRKR